MHSTDIKRARSTYSVRKQSLNFRENFSGRNENNAYHDDVSSKRGVFLRNFAFSAIIHVRARSSLNVQQVEL